MDPIYCISEASGCIRYVGVTNGPLEKRLKGHLREARRSKEWSHKLCWLRSLPEPPTIEVIEWVLPGDRVEREMYWISLFRDYGHKLVNGTDGGEGATGHIPSCEHRAKISVALTGRKKTPEHIERVASANKGKKRTLESIERMVAAITGKKHSLETCAKMSKSRRGRGHSKKHSNNTSGFVGVFRGGKKWQARLRSRHIGTFQKIEDAVFARNLTIALENK